MSIRTFVPGDEVAQVGIYNEAAADLPKFKPATVDEVRRRLIGPDFSADSRFYALANNRPVGYCTIQPNGRISFPWCRKGYEITAGPLFERALDGLRQRGLGRAFAAYRADWLPQKEFFEKQGFRQARDMVNFVMDLAEMPTPSARPNTGIEPLTEADLPALPALGAGVFRTADVAELGRYYLHNPHFPPDAVFVLRSRADAAPVAMGLVIANGAVADPRAIDPAMPCFRLGAAGTEGLTLKRVNGLFTVAVPPTRDVSPVALDLMSYAALRLESTDVGTLAAQAPSDAPHLIRFYKQYFRRQGSVPVFERDL
jgi:hypothetical protein